MTPPLTHRVLPGVYADSLVLMQLQRALEALPGIDAAAAVMATAPNRDLLAEQGLLPADVDAARPDDLLAVVRAADAAAGAAALERVEVLLAERRTAAPEGEHRPRSLRAALAALPAARWVLVSVPGRWAGGVAREALAAGRHVFLYSDNVPLAEEVALKAEAARRGLLVMGPDCGTAIVAGAGLGFANRVRRGAVGLVAASGTGLQAVACGIDARGLGISQALGTGGRDLSTEVGGATARAALDLLARDPETRVIVLVSKPPDPRVAARLLAAARATDKPVVVWFLGAAPPARRRGNLWFAVGSDEAAELAAELARSLEGGEAESGDAERPGDRQSPPTGAADEGEGSRSGAGPGAATTAAAALPGGAVGPPGAAAAIGSAAFLEASRTAQREGGGGESAAGLPDAEAPRQARAARGAAASESGREARQQREGDDSVDAGGEPGSVGVGGEEGLAAGPGHGPRWLRGLFSGGTLAAETVVGLAPFLSPLAGNLSLPGVLPFAGATAGFAGHLVLDLGADEFTAGRPHPMLDPSLVAEQVRAAAGDPTVGLLLVDVVLGDGAHADPAGEIAPALGEALAAARATGRRLEAVAILVGSDGDPQDRAAQAERLEGAGARVAGSVAESLRYALSILPPPVEAVAAPVPLAALAPPLAAVNVGLPSFAAALDAQDAEVLHVDWRPPAGGDERLARILERAKKPSTGVAEP